MKKLLTLIVIVLIFAIIVYYYHLNVILLTELSYVFHIFYYIFKLQICSVLNLVLDDYFPEQHGVMVIAESGRFFVESAFTLVTRVIDKVVAADDPGMTD